MNVESAIIFANIFIGKTEGIFPDGEARGMLSSIVLKGNISD
ncbi:hypothetical protein PJI16_06820 [Nitrospira sp. MA-1]|nr:hypothetical protein [Nitrospira sp. MA-1]